MSARTLLRQRRTWLIGLPVLLLVLFVGGPWLYLNVIRDDPPERLSLDDAPATTTTAGQASAGGDGDVAAREGIDGTWAVGEGSQAGYRVKEILFGQDAEAVGRTDEVTGTLQAAGTTISGVTVEVDMASVTSDESRRDGQFRGRIMSTDRFPTATFVQTGTIELGELPATGEEVAVTATGDLTLRGVTRPVKVPLDAVLEDGRIVVSGAVTVDFDDFEIPDASGGPASVGRTGEIELLLVFVPAP